MRGWRRNIGEILAFGHEKKIKDGCIVLVGGIISSLKAVPKSADFTLWCHSNYIRMRLMQHFSVTCSGARFSVSLLLSIPLPQYLRLSPDNEIIKKKHAMCNDHQKMVHSKLKTSSAEMYSNHSYFHTLMFRHAQMHIHLFLLQTSKQGNEKRKKRLHITDFIVRYCDSCLSGGWGEGGGTRLHLTENHCIALLWLLGNCNWNSSAMQHNSCLHNCTFKTLNCCNFSHIHLNTSSSSSKHVFYQLG